MTATAWNDDQRGAALIASLPGMRWEQLEALARLGQLGEVCQRLAAGEVAPLATERPRGVIGPGLLARWRGDLARLDPARLEERYRRAEVNVVVASMPAFPRLLAVDGDPPSVLFMKGSAFPADTPAVGIVGTRSATAAGLETARWLGRELGARRVPVVSGLALGIDGAAHDGVLRASGFPVGVVASGLDVPYPRRHERLWDSVGGQGLLLSEAPLGGQPAAELFPRRNRLIAALSRVVIVVESHTTGGSLITAVEAANRGRTVLAVPGPIRSPASAGSNRLLDVALPCRDLDDVLVALEWLDVEPIVVDRRIEPGDREAMVLAALGWEDASIDVVMTRTGLTLGAVTGCLHRLEHDGWVGRVGGRWQRLASAP